MLCTQMPGVVEHERRRRRQIDVVAHERHGALPEQRQVRRIELQPLLDGRSGHEAARVVGDARRGEGRRAAGQRLRDEDVDGVPDPRRRAGQDRQLVDERAEQLGDVLAQVVVEQPQLAAVEASAPASADGRCRRSAPAAARSTSIRWPTSR